jgi:UDP-N-acetylglucosamine acyltransferase
MSFSDILNFTNYISHKAVIGKNVKIGPNVIIKDDVIIGDNVQIDANVLVDDGARISDNVKIHLGAAISVPPQHTTDYGENKILEIGENTVIREYATISRGTNVTGKTTIGANCYIMTYVHVAHDCRIGNNVVLASACNLGGHTEVGDYTFIGGLAAIHQFVKIGSYVMFGGGFKAVKDVPPYVVAGNQPAKYGGVNVIGLRRNGFTKEQITKIGDIYRILYNTGLNISDAVKKIKNDYELKDEVKNIIDFIETSERGIIRK